MAATSCIPPWNPCQQCPAHLGPHTPLEGAPCSGFSGTVCPSSQAHSRRPMSPSPLSLLAQAGVDSARQTWHWGPRKGEAGLCWLLGLRCPGPCYCPGQDGDTLLELPWCGAALQLQAWHTSTPTGCLHGTGHVPNGNIMALQSHRLRKR